MSEPIVCSPAAQFLLAMFILMFVVVMLNVLIAIVSDSYDAAMAESNALFCRSRFELITETASFHPTWLGVSDDEIKRMLKERLGHAMAASRGPHAAGHGSHLTLGNLFRTFDNDNTGPPRALFPVLGILG